MRPWILINCVAAVLVLTVPRVASAEPSPSPAEESEDSEPRADEATHRAYCLQYTGSRIRPPAGQCASTRGRVYTREDIERTGDVNLNGALRRLDPSLR